MFSFQMIEILENNPILYNKNTSYLFWMILYIILLAYPYQYIWYIPYLLCIMYISLVFIVFKLINEFTLNEFMM